MANIKSAKKRILTNNKARMNNKVKKTSLRTSIKTLEDLISKGNKEEAQAYMSTVSKKLDSAVTSGFIHKNKASRNKSRLMKKINEM